MSLFSLGNYKLHSGGASYWKIDCDCLTDSDITTLAEMIRKIVAPYGSVEGVPKGGLRLAEALLPHCVLTGRHLIVDDVLTTGASMEKLREQREGDGKGTPCQGAVLFARGPCPSWIKAVFQVSEPLWLHR